MAKLPWFKFFAYDWMSNKELRCVSSGARGLWIDMLAIMHDSRRRGYLQLDNGKPMTPECLAKLTGNSADETSRWLQELENFGVLFRMDDGCIYSRRQVRDESARTGTRERVKKHRCNEDVTRDVTEASDSDSSSDSKELEPVKKKPSLEEFDPGDSHFLLASELKVNLAQALGQFKDYCRSKGKIYKDYDAAFRNWLRNSPKYGVPNGASKQVSTQTERRNNNQQAIIDGFTTFGRSLAGRNVLPIQQGSEPETD